MTTPTAAQLWQRLLDEAGEEAIESVLKMSDAEVEAELTEHGFDVEDERRKGDEALASLFREPATAKPRP